MAESLQKCVTLNEITISCSSTTTTLIFREDGIFTTFRKNGSFSLIERFCGELRPETDDDAPAEPCIN